MLVYKRMKKNEKKYAIQLAKDEIDIEPKRLDKFKTYLIYNDEERIGYVSFSFKPDKTIYIYILVFEKHAQRQGFASIVIDYIFQYGRENYPGFKGLSATVHRVNEAGINTAKKYGFKVTKERPNYIDFLKPIS